MRTITAVSVVILLSLTLLGTACRGGSTNPETAQDATTTGDAGADGGRGNGWDVQRPTDVFNDFEVKETNGRLSPKWVELVGTENSDAAKSVTVDGSGNIYIAGVISNVLRDVVCSRQVRTDGYLAKFDQSGNLQWLRLTGLCAFDVLADVAVGPAGNVYVAGNGGETSSGPISDGFVVKYDRFGNEEWYRYVTESKESHSDNRAPVHAVAVGEGGQVYVVGTVDGTLSGQQTAGGDDGYVAKYDPSGNQRWVRRIGGGGPDDARDVAVDGENRVYVVGKVEMDPNKRYGDRDAYVMRLDASGDLEWRRVIGTAAHDRGWSVAVAPSGNIYLGGEADTISRPGQLRVQTYHGFHAKLTASGVVNWARYVELPGARKVRDVAVDKGGQLYLAGRAALTNGGGESYVATYRPTGTRRWLKFAGTRDPGTITAIATGFDGDLFAVGKTTYGIGTGSYHGGNWDGFVMSFE